MTSTMPTFFISHGGGPWPWVPGMREAFSRTADWLQKLPATLPAKPKAIVSISGHWETPEFAVSSAAKPPMKYDYSGFPPHTYSLAYKAPGEPLLADQIAKAFAAAGLAMSTDPSHGFDHGTFVPLFLMYPEANLPVVSMSIKQSYSPIDHFRAGEVLASLRDEQILILGSGLSYHNMRGFGTGGAKSVSEAFGSWLEQAVTEKDMARRKKYLMEWETAPSARAAHPREDHLVPLMIVAGAARGDMGKLEFKDHVMGVDMASYRFG